MKKFFFYFAATGWLLSLALHLLSAFDVRIAVNIPFTGLLTIGIFVVWFPVVIWFYKEISLGQPGTAAVKEKSPNLFEVVFKNKPGWIKLLALASFYYAIINFILFYITNFGAPDIKFNRHAGEEDIIHYSLANLRGSSGHWLAFYGIAAAYLFPPTTSQKVENKRTSSIQEL